jgi:ligand-binding SRPBCC domain-containing protein
MLHQIKRSTLVNCSIEKAWNFIATPHNLNRITPENMAFEILSNLPEKMVDGLLIEYNVTIPLFGRWRWLTEIKHIREGVSFVDEQRAGPYKLWYHYHEVRSRGEQTEIIDQVTYKMPFWIFGGFVNALIVRRQLKEVFDYREAAFKQLLEG